MSNPFKVNIQPGQVWICKSVFNPDLVDTDIIAKVMKVFEPTVENPKGSVFLIRNVEFGFKSIAPVTMGIQTFLELYQYVGEVKS